MKDNQIIRVGWFMKKYQKFDIRVGKFDKESREFISKNGQRCITFLIYIEIDTQLQLTIF